MKRTAFALILMSTFLFSAAGALCVDFARANPLPDIDPKITIENPQNTTYNANTITLNFTVESNWGVFPLFYSLDEQEMKPIENLTTISQDEVNLGKSPSVIRTTQKGSCALSNLSEGWHNVTFYLITDHEISLFRSYEKGEILCSATTEFMIDIPPFPTALVVAPLASLAVVGAGLMIYLRKRNQ